jgi:hypothetical protein
MWHFAPMQWAHKARRFPQNRIPDISRRRRTGWRPLGASVKRKRDSQRKNVPSGTPPCDWVFVDEWTIEDPRSRFMESRTHAVEEGSELQLGVP